jgi:hypothetical protein
MVGALFIFQADRGETMPGSTVFRQDPIVEFPTKIYQKFNGTSIKTLRLVLRPEYSIPPHCPQKYKRALSTD